MKNITVEELKARMDAGEKLNIIDCREPQEYAEYNIGAKLVPLGQIQTMQVEELDEWKDQEVIIHCRSGHRMMIACLFLDTLGFKDTKNLAGVILAWKEKYDPAK